jgi:DNA-binding beta-propeller fold protein YncE/cytochrome c peroxidase
MKRLAGPLVLLAVAGAPTAALALDVVVAHEPTTLGEPSRFQATVTDAVGTIEYRWDFGDGTESTEWTQDLAAIEYTYAEPGHYTVNLLVRDDETPFAGQASTHTVVRPRVDGQAQSSTTIVLDESRGLVVNANPDNDTVSVVDANALQKVAEIAVFDGPSSLALAPDGRLWVTHREDFAIAIVDLDTFEVVGGLRLPYASQPAGIVMGAERAYVSLQALGRVVAIDTQTIAVVGSVDVGPWARGLALSADEASLYVTHFISGPTSGAVSIVDPASMTLRSQAELVVDPGPDTDQSGRGVPNYVFSVALTPDGTEAWVTAKKDNVERGLARDGEPLTPDNAVRPMLASIDTATGLEDLAERLDIDDRNLPSHVTFSPLGDYAFVTITGSSFIDVRDRYGARRSAADLKEAGLAPRGSVLGPDGKLFVHGWLSRSIVVFDVSRILASEDFAAVRLAEIPVVASESLAPDVLAGKQVFYDSEDTRMTAEGYISCGTCHFEGFEDGRVWDFTDRGEGLRNNISLLGRRGTGHGRVHWSANFDEIQDFEHDIRAAFGGSGFVDDPAFDTSPIGTPLGDPKAGASADLDALAAFVASLDAVHRSPFRDPDGSLTDDGEAGEAIFSSLGCDACHGGPDFTDSATGVVYDVGTMSELSGQRLGGALEGIDTPTLLGIWETAPYLHDGSAPTLRDVLVTRNPDDRHGAVSGLSELEIEQLVAYLQQLDGLEPPARLPFEEEPDEEASSPEEGCACGSGQRGGGLLLLLLLLLPRCSTRSRRRSTR